MTLLPDTSEGRPYPPALAGGVSTDSATRRDSAQDRPQVAPNDVADFRRGWADSCSPGTITGEYMPLTWPSLPCWM